MRSPPPAPAALRRGARATRPAARIARAPSCAGSSSASRTLGSAIEIAACMRPATNTGAATTARPGIHSSRFSAKPRRRASSTSRASASGVARRGGREGVEALLELHGVGRERELELAHGRRVDRHRAADLRRGAQEAAALGLVEHRDAAAARGASGRRSRRAPAPPPRARGAPPRPAGRAAARRGRAPRGRSRGGSARESSRSTSPRRSSGASRRWAVDCGRPSARPSAETPSGSPAAWRWKSTSIDFSTVPVPARPSGVSLFGTVNRILEQYAVAAAGCQVRGFRGIFPTSPRVVLSPESRLG